MAAELNIAKHQYSKALQVQVHMCDRLPWIKQHMVNAEICLFSKVLVQFAGIVLIRDESRMDVATTSDKEKVPGQECEVQESRKEKTKSLTVTTEETAAEDNGRLK